MSAPPNQLQVPWSYDAFTTMFPEFTGRVSAPQAQAYWTMANAYHRNDGGGPITNDVEQAMCLNLLTAHIAQLLGPDANGQTSEVVGRLTSFSEGSASGSVEYQGPQEAAWYLQTKYGAMYWELMSAQRTMFYRRAPKRLFNVGLPFPFIGNF